VSVLGSTLVVKILSESPVEDADSGVYSQKYGDYWLVGGASNSGGTVLRQYFSDERLRELEAELQPDSPTGLDYYPLPRTGERFPVSDPELTPKITPRPDSDALFLQGLLEGIANIEAFAYGKLTDLGCPRPTKVTGTGGGSRNRAWNRIREKRLGVPVETADHQEAAYGAALIALRGGIIG
jgi:sugar (pentulose or hexulose) kinase